MKRVLIVRSEFSSAHLYKNEEMTEKENRENFGRCYTEFGHGHNYKIEVGVQLKPNTPDSELLTFKKKWDDELLKLTRVLDHEHLNFVIPEFKNVNPTTENILLYFEKKLSDLKFLKSVAYIKLFEMENLWSEKYYVTL